MNWARGLGWTMLMLLALGAAQAAECPTVQMGEEGRRKAESLAAKTREALQNSGAQVALLGRAGSDAPQKRFVKKINFWNYTHGGLVYRRHPDGEWTAVHLLNTCGEKSEVFSQSLTEFYLDNPFEYRTVAAIPSPRLQAVLEELIVRRGLAERYHGDVYSSISYPFSLARQNSNEYVLDTLSAALAFLENRAADDRHAAKEYFLASPHRAAFVPEILRAGAIETVGALLGLGPDNATLTDHSAGEILAGEFEFVSVGSLIQFMENLGMLQSAEELALDDIHKATDTVIH